ncbi:MAG: Zn-dependent oligopeptidase [Bdellovibrionales bacterium]|nr:Zn-dependent oligopeptidase [Bdellovibrionales bacterium]
MMRPLQLAIALGLVAGISVHAAPTPRLIRYEYAPGDIRKLCDESMAHATQRLNAIAAVPTADRRAENTLLVFEDTLTDLSDEIGPLTFMKDVSTDDKLREEGSECEEKSGQYWVEVFTRKDLYDALKSVKTTKTDEKRLLSETLKAFEMNGLQLPADKLAKMKELSQKLTTLETKFSTNINEDKTELRFTGAELNGVPDSVLAHFKREGDKYVVTTKSTDYVPVMENAKVAETRKKMVSAYYDRAAGTNIKVLDEILELRRQIAAVMGYPTWADYKTANGRMAKSAKDIWDFLNGLRDKLAERAKQDLVKLQEFKKTMDPNESGFHQWDLTYYAYQLKKRDYTLDDEKIREYFPADVVIKGMFAVYSKLLSVRYEEVKNAKVWAPGVKLYRVLPLKGSDPIGYFYTDFIPRPGKYSHAAAFSLIAGRSLPKGSYTKPVSAIVANFNPPSEGKPSLMSHDEVETVFHEFGHIMHQTLTRAPYGSLSGSSVARDFVEAPSQMLENWVWDAKVLSSLSGHYATKEKLPADLLKRMIEARDFNQGQFYIRQLYFGFLDMTYHTTKSAIDTTEVSDKLYKDLVGVDPLPNSHFQASFGHLMGYSAGYYGYLWSEVFAADMFTRFAKDGLLNPQVGMSYRKSILEPGNMRDANELLKDFLGREPNKDAFFKKLHIL